MCDFCLTVILRLSLALLLVCFQLVHDLMHEFIFLLWEINAIETRKRQGGKRGPVDRVRT